MCLMLLHEENRLLLGRMSNHVVSYRLSSPSGGLVLLEGDSKTTGTVSVTALDRVGGRRRRAADGGFATGTGSTGSAARTSARATTRAGARAMGCGWGLGRLQGRLLLCRLGRGGAHGVAGRRLDTFRRCRRSCLRGAVRTRGTTWCRSWRRLLVALAEVECPRCLDGLCGPPDLLGVGVAGLHLLLHFSLGRPNHPS